MLINPLMMSVPEPDRPSSNNGNDDLIGDLARKALEKTTLTKGSGLVLIIGLAILAFIIMYSKIPAMHVSFLKPNDLRIAFFVDIGFMLLFSGLFFLPEIIKRFKDPGSID